MCVYIDRDIDVDTWPDTVLFHLIKFNKYLLGVYYLQVTMLGDACSRF